MKTKEELIATCQAIRKNNSRRTKLDLNGYGSLIDRNSVQQVIQSLEKNTVVEDLGLSRYLCADTAFQLSHFLRSSPSLRHLTMVGRGEDTEELGREIEILKISIVIESISRRSSLVKLSLSDVAFGKHYPLEGFLSSTRTLLDLTMLRTSP